MAERLDLTPAEILARQRMLEEALARQDADAELFSRMDQPRPKEQPDPSKVVRGIPEAEENPITQILSPFMPFERDVIRQPQSTFETIQRLRPGGLDGEAFVEEDVRTSYTPGEYGPRRFATPPIVDAISGGLRFGDRLLFGDDKEQAEARETVRQGIGALPGLPKAIVESVIGGAENVARGNITTRDAEGNITRPGQFAEALAMFPAARLFADVPEGDVVGIFGGSKSVTGSQKIKEHEKIIYEQGMPEEVASKQTGVFIGADKQPRVYLGSIDVNDSALDVAAGSADTDISMLKLQEALNPETSQVLLEYPELQDVNLVLVPSQGSSMPNARAVRKGYKEASARIYGTPQTGVSSGKDRVIDNFYDPVSNTIYVAHDYSRTYKRGRAFPKIEGFEEPLSDYAIQQKQKQKDLLNQKVGAGIQNYIQQREGFAPVETVPDVMEALSKNPVYKDRTESLVSELDPNVAQSIINRKNATLSQIDLDIFDPPIKKFDEKVKERNEKMGHERTHAINDPFRVNNLDKGFSRIFVGAPRTREYMNKPQSLINLYSVNTYPIGQEGVKKQLLDTFSMTPNQILTEINNNTFGANSSARFRAAAKTIREAPELQREKGPLDIVKGRKGTLTEDAERKAIEFETAADIYLEIPEKTFKSLFDTVTKSDEQTFLYRQALSALDRKKGEVQNVLTPGFNLQVFSPGAQEVRLASDLLDPTKREKQFGDVEPSAAALEMSLRDPGFVSNQLQILPLAAQQAYKKGEKYTEDLAREAEARGLHRYDPTNPFFNRLDKALQSVKRDSGNAKEWIKDFRKKALGQGVTERELELLNFDERINEVGRVLTQHTNGKLNREDVSALLASIDRPIEVVDLSKTDPDLNSRFRNTFLGGGPATQNSKTFIWKQPPKEGDKQVFVEGHWNATSTGVVPSTPDIVAGRNLEIKHPNTFMHARTTLREDQGEETLLLEELQSDALQKQGRSGDVPLLKDLAAARSLAVETLLLKAAEQGSDSFAIVPGYASRFIQNMPDKDYGPEYDQKLPAVLKKLAKRYGAQYTEEIPILVTDSQGKPMLKEAFDVNQTHHVGMLNNVEEMFDEKTGEGLYVMARGIRLTPELREKILKTQIGRFYGGEVRQYAKGGMVTNMNRPVISRGLSNLIRNYSQGPLARLDVPRETVPMQTMNGGGPVGGKYGKYNPFSGDDPLQELNRVQKKLISDDLLQMDDLGYGRPENNEFLYLGDTSTETSGNVPSGPIVTQSQGTSGTGDTSPIEDGPGGPPIEETITDAPLSDPTVPYTLPVETTKSDKGYIPGTGFGDGRPTTTQTTTTQPITQTTTQQPQQPVGTGRTPDQVMADRAAEEAAAAEAERIRLANLAAQEQLAAEQLAAQQQVVQDNVVPVLGEEPTAAQTLDQELAQELADQATTQLAAQQNLDSQVLGAEQLVDQQAADRALLEAQLANQDAPTAVFQAPTPDTVDRSTFGVPPAISTQEVDPNAPNFLVADMIDDYTSGYAPTLGMDIKETVYPYEGMTQEEMEAQNVYRGQVFQPMPKLSFGSGSQEGEEGEGTEQTATGMPKLDFGSTTSGSGTKGRYVTLPTGQSVFIPDYGDISFNTENPESEPGQYGLRDEQRYQCPAYYTLAFEGGQPYCKKIDKSQWPSGGRQRARVNNLPSRTAVSVIELNEAGAETREGYAQGGPVQNFNYGGPAQFQGPFGGGLDRSFFRNFMAPEDVQRLRNEYQQRGQTPLGQVEFGQKPMGPESFQRLPVRNQITNEQQFNRLGSIIRSDGPGSMGSPIVTAALPDPQSARIPPDQMDRLRTRFTPTGIMGPPQQMGQVAEPDTQQLANQLQNVTQQVNQLSSHLGAPGGTAALQASALQTARLQAEPTARLQGGIGGLLGNLRPQPAPLLRAQTGPVTPPMFQTFR